MQYYNLDFINPGYLLICSALFLFFINKRLLPLVAILINIIVIFILKISIMDCDLHYLNMFGMHLTDVLFTSANIFFSYLFLILLFLIILFLIGTKSINRILLIGLFIHVGAVIGTILAGDFLSLFFMIEISALGALIMMLSMNNPINIIVRYLTMHGMAAILMLCGITYIIYQNNSYDIVNLAFNFNELKKIDRIVFAKCLFLAGLMINIGCPPFTSLLSKTYSQIHPIIALCMSNFVSKALLLVILNIFIGSEILRYLGIVMIIYGLFYSCFETQIRKILIFNMISQFGIVCALLSYINEDIKHAIYILIVNHILYNIVMFMSVVIIKKKLDIENINLLKGVFHKYRRLFLCVIVASLSCIGFPFTFGYYSKLILMQSIAHDHLLLLFINIANIIVVMNIGIRFLIKNFIGREHNYSYSRDLNFITFFTMFILSIFSLGSGVIYNYFYDSPIFNIYNIIKPLLIWIIALVSFYILFGLLKIDRYKIPDILDIYSIFKIKIPNILPNIKFNISNQNLLLPNVTISIRLFILLIVLVMFFII